jgi:hypothetical protein
MATKLKIEKRGDEILKESSPLKPSSQMNSNLVGSTYGRFCIKFPHNQKQELPVAAMFVNGLGRNVQFS